MKKLTLLALSLGMTFGVFAQKFQFAGEATPMDLSNAHKAVAVKADAAKVILTVTDFVGDDAKIGWTFEGDTTGGIMFIGLFERELDGSKQDIASAVLQELLRGGGYWPFEQKLQNISELFSNTQTGEKTYLDEGTTYSLWIAIGNEAFANNSSSGADMNWAYCNFTGEGVVSEGALGLKDFQGVGINAASIVVTNVYPNPTADKVTITAASKINSLEVVNALGQVVYTMDVNDQTATLYTDSFAKGTYVVRLNTELGQATSKLYVR